MYGYCKLREHCPKQHIDTVCPISRECNNNGCVLRHPNTCKYFARNKKCKFVECAYSHEKDDKDLKIEIIENTSLTFKHDIEELNKANKEKLDKVQVETRANTKQLAKLKSTMDEIVERRDIIEQEQADYIEKDDIVEVATTNTDTKKVK